MRGVQARGARIIAGAFRSTAGAALNIKLHLLPVQNQLDIALYEAMLGIIISSIHPLIKSQRSFSDRALAADQTQNQRSLYAQLSPLHKLEIRYAAVFNRDLFKLELRMPFLTAPWWQPSEITIAANDEEAMATYDAITATGTHLAIYTDGSGINGKVETSAVTLFIPIVNEPSMVAVQKLTYLWPLAEYTVYSGELIGLNLVLQIAETHPTTQPVAIFNDSQAVIRAVKSPRQQSGQYMIRNLVQRIASCGKSLHIHWILAHEGVPGNEAADIAANEATGWRPAGRGPLAPRVLTAAVRSEIRTRAKKNWAETRKTERHERSIYKIIKKLTEDVLQKFKQMIRSKSAVIVQAKTKKKKTN